jgi:hypothetical protein
VSVKKRIVLMVAGIAARWLWQRVKRQIFRR